MSSLPSYSTRDAYLREVVPSQRPEATLPQVAVSVDGFIRHCPLAEILQRHLAHMAAAVTALRLSKSSVSLCLTEEASFIRPPWSRDRQTSEAFALKDGMGGSIKGFVNIVSTTHRLVQDVRVTLTALQSVAFPTGGYYEAEVFRRELSLADLTGSSLIELQRGVNCFEFALLVPSSAAISVKSIYGRVRYSLRAEVPSSGSFLKSRLACEREITIVGLPERSEEEEMRLDIDEQSNGDWSGQARLEMNTNRLTIGLPLACKLTLVAPPDNLTIFGIHVYLVQTVRLCSPSGRTETVESPRQTILEAGYLDRWRQPDFVERARTEHRSELLCDGSIQGANKGDVWEWAAEGVLPVNNALKPTTIFWTDDSPGLTFSHDLVFDVFFQRPGVGPHHDDRLMIATMYKRDVTVASSCCKIEALTLPCYVE